MYSLVKEENMGKRKERGRKKGREGGRKKERKEEWMVNKCVFYKITEGYYIFVMTVFFNISNNFTINIAEMCIMKMLLKEEHIHCVQ